MPVELPLLAPQKALDILAVAPQHQRGDDDGQRRVQAIVAAEEPGGHRHADGGGDGAQGDVSRGQPQQGEQAPGDQRHPPVQQPHQHGAGQDALAALEAEEHGEHVAQLAAQPTQQDAQRPVARQIVEDDAADEAGRHGLAHVQQNDAQSVLGAVGAVEIGEAGVAAAMLPHVIADDEVAHQHGAVETAQKIAQQYHHEHGEHRCPNEVGQPSSSPFWRMVMVMGVPSRPNTLRI